MDASAFGCATVPIAVVRDCVRGPVPVGPWRLPRDRSVSRFAQPCSTRNAAAFAMRWHWDLRWQASR